MAENRWPISFVWLWLLALPWSAGFAEPQRPPDVHPPGYETFAVLRPSGENVPEPLLDAGRSAMIDEMLAKGYREARRHDADLLVSIHGRISEMVRVGQYDQTIPKDEWTGFYPYANAYEFEQRELTIVIADRARKTVVWERSAEKSVSGNKPVRPERLSKVIRKLLKKFPARS